MSTLQNVLFINNSLYMDGPQATFINAIREKLSRQNIDVASDKDIVSLGNNHKARKRTVSAVASTSDNEKNRQKADIICSALEYLLSKQEKIVNQIEPMLLKIEEISPSLDHQLTNVIKNELKIARKKNNYKSKNSKTSQKCDKDKIGNQDVGDGQEKNIKYLYKSNNFSNYDSGLMTPFQFSNEISIIYKNQSLRKFIMRDSKKTLSSRSLPIMLMNKLSTPHTNPIWNLCKKEKSVILIQIPGVMAFPNLYSTILSRSQMNLHTASPIENHLLSSNRNSGDTRVSKINQLDEDNRETNSFRIRLRATRTLYNGTINDTEESHVIKPNQTTALNKQDSADDENGVKCINEEHNEKDKSEDKSKEEIGDTLSLHIPQNVFTDTEKDNLQRIFAELLHIEVKRKLKKQKLYSRSENILAFLMGMSKNYLRSRFIDKNTVKDRPNVAEYLYKNILELREYGINTEPLNEPVTESTTNTEPVTESINEAEVGIESGINTEPNDENSDAQIDTAPITSKMEQREKLFAINQKVFSDFENKLKYVKILKSSESSENLDQKLSANAVVGDNIDVNILNVMKAHNKCNKEISKLRLDANEEVAPVSDDSQESVLIEDVQKPITNESNETGDKSTQAVVDFTKTEIREDQEVEKQELPMINVPDFISTPNINVNERELDEQPFISHIDHNLLMSKLIIKQLDDFEKESPDTMNKKEEKETLQAISVNNFINNVSCPQRHKNDIDALRFKEEEESLTRISKNNVQQKQSMSKLIEKILQQSKTIINKQQQSSSALKLKGENISFVPSQSRVSKNAQLQEQKPKTVKMNEPPKILKHQNVYKTQPQHKNMNFNMSDRAEKSQWGPKITVKKDTIKQTNNKIRTQTNQCANSDSLFKSISEITKGKVQNYKIAEPSRSTPKIGLTQSKTKYAQFSTHPDTKKINTETQNEVCAKPQNSATEIKEQTQKSCIVLNKCSSNIALNEKLVERHNSEKRAAVNKQSLLKVFEENQTKNNKGSEQKLNKTDNGSMNKVNCKDSVSACEVNDKLAPPSRDSSVDKNESKQIKTVMAFNKKNANKNVSRIPVLQPTPRTNSPGNEKTQQNLKEPKNKNSKQINASSDCSESTSEEIKSSELSNSSKTENRESTSEVHVHQLICNELIEQIVENAFSKVTLQNEVKPTEDEECNNETKKEREPWGTNVFNIIPVHFKKPTFFSTIPNGTIWNQEPRNQNQIDYFMSEDKKFKKHKKYRYETKEVDSANGKKVRITYLVLDK